MPAPKVQFLLEVAEKHPEPFFALPPERRAAEELSKLGLLDDLDAKHPGCFRLSARGVQMIAVLERRVTELP